MHRIGLRSGTLEGGSKIAGMYDLLETLGRGHFAVVKLARHVFTGEKVAVKVIDKAKLDEVSRAHLYQEVRCMKLVQHPNVVRLYEVIDTNTKLYLILELGDGGDLYDYIMRHEGRGLDEDTARNYFRQIVRAIDYCHRLHVVHRDLKPENVVFFETLGVVKLTDFGFSNRFCPGQKLETSCGSLAYSAPEILLGDSYDAPAVDVWSLGVILYMLVCGQAPFQEANDSETLTMIMDCKYTIPVHVSDQCKRLIARMLVREPDQRASLEEIAHDSWVALNEEPQVELLPLVSREHVSEEDHAIIIQKMANGNIATKEEIIEALDKNEYNYITATYFLLAERRLKQVRQAAQPKRPNSRNKFKSTNSPGSNTPVVSVSPVVEGELDSPVSTVNPSLLATPSTIGDVPGQNFRTRKCSIVAEEEDEEDDDIGVSGSGSEDIASSCSFNRRGSRSEGKLSAMVKDRLVEAERRKESLKVTVSQSTEEAPKTRTTTILKESATVCIPTSLHASSTPSVSPRYKSLPSPVQSVRSAGAYLNEIFEEGEAGFRRVDSLTEAPANLHSSRPGRVSPRTMANYEQRRSKFHKTRTASCSSSDASDDDSESRKKRAHKLKTLPQRRDSHDDSSDSQDPGGGGSGGGSGGTGGSVGNHDVQGQGSQEHRTGSSSGGGSGGGSSGSGSGSGGTGGGGSGSGSRSGNTSGGTTGSGAAGAPSGSGHRVGRRRARETRLRESQSLNRITEVQEAELASVPVPNVPNSKSRSLGTRILQGLSLKSSTSLNSPLREDRPGCVPRTETDGPDTKPVSIPVTPKLKTPGEEKENVCNSGKSLASKSSTGGRCKGLGGEGPELRKCRRLWMCYVAPSFL